MPDRDATYRQEIPTATPDSTRAFLDFARRLANFGLGELDDPRLTELRPRPTRPTLMA